MTQETRDEDLLFRAIHGELSDEEASALAERLKADPAFAADYIRFSRDEALLAEEVSRLRAREQMEQAVSVAARARDRRRWRPTASQSWRAAAAISVVVAASVLVVAWVMLRPGPEVRGPIDSTAPVVRHPRGDVETPPLPAPQIPKPLPPPAPDRPEPPRESAEPPRAPEVPQPPREPPEAPKSPEETPVQRRPTVPAEDLKVQVARATGPVFFRAAGTGKDLPAKAGAVLAPGDTLDTRGARATLHFADGTAVHCNALTSVQLQPRGVLLQQGEVCCSVRKGDQFQVATAETVARVLGTRFSVQRSPAFSTATVTVAEGTVEVQGQASQDPVRVEEGYRLAVSKGGRVGAPERADPAALAMAWVNELRPVLLHETFKGYGARSDPPDWRDTRPDNSPIEDDSLFKIFPVRGAKAFGPASTAVNIHSHYVGRGAADWTNYRYSGRMMKAAPKADAGVTFFSRLPQGENRYYRLRHFSGSERLKPFHVAPHPQQPTVPLKGTTSTAVVPEVGTWYEFQIEVEVLPTATALRARVWKAGTERPREWQIDCADDRAERLRSGSVGVWTKGGGSYFDDLRVEELD